jgi:DNA-binding Lrp family transcriptional regulator
MDEKDIRIFCEMGFKYYNYAGKNRRPSPKEIGKKLGLDEKTVRTRVKNMENDGFIESYRAVPNPCLFQLPLICTCGFRAPDIRAKQQALLKLRESPVILDIGDFLGESVGVILAASSEQDEQQRIQRLSELTGLPSMPFIPARRFPTPTTTPNRLDWQLIKSLRPSAIRPTREIADRLGITYRTAEYRISRLLESRVFFVRAFVNARDPKGIIIYSLFLELDDEGHERIKRKLLERYRDRLWFNFSPPSPVIILNMFSTSVGEAEDKLLNALSQQGVHGGSLIIVKGWIEPTQPSWIDQLVDQRIAAQ